jgi:hypothetical protein
MTCKGICVYHKAKKESIRGYYVSGQKRCQACEIFIEWKGLWCPCCGSKLRTGPRNMKYKIKMRVINREVMQPLTL